MMMKIKVLITTKEIMMLIKFSIKRKKKMIVLGTIVVEDRCVLKKWLRCCCWIVIGRYGYKSSFGANKDRTDCRWDTGKTIQTMLTMLTIQTS